MSPKPSRLFALSVLSLSLILGCAKAPPSEPTDSATASPSTSRTDAAPAGGDDEGVVDLKDSWSPSSEPTVEVEKLPPPTLATRAEEYNRLEVLGTVYFDFDKYELKETARNTLAANAGWMKTNDQFNVVIQGHCDERGTVEYNLALGEQRAVAVRSYLVSLGVPAHRLSTISFGEERPAANGHDEAAWSQNRRAEFVIEAP